MVLFLASCAPRPQPKEDPVPDPSPVPAYEEGASLDDVLIHRLSVNLGLAADDITVLEHREVIFSDLCLDTAPPDTGCAQTLTSGRIFILEANGFEHEYHTTMAGDSIRPATLALTWTREGGIAGHCDSLTVYLSGEVFSSNCRSQPNETSGYFSELLSSAQRSQFTMWFTKYGEMNLDISDPEGVADRMVNTLILHGVGPGSPSRVDQQAMFDWAQNLFRKLNSYRATRKPPDIGRLFDAEEVFRVGV